MKRFINSDIQVYTSKLKYSFLSFWTYAMVSLVRLPGPSMRFSDSSTSILFVYMYFLASCMGARASPGVASSVSLTLIYMLLSYNCLQVSGKLGKFV